MAIGDEYVAVLREELGAGFGQTALAGLMKEYVKRKLKSKVLARREAALDDTALVAARAAMERTLLDEESSRKASEATIVATLDLDVENF